MMGHKAEKELRRQLHAAEEARARAEADRENERRTNEHLDRAFSALHTKLGTLSTEIDFVRRSTDRIETALKPKRVRAPRVAAKKVAAKKVAKATTAKRSR